MSGSKVLVELVIVLGTAAVVTVVFQALRLPVVLGYVLAGLLIGPHVPVPLVANAELVHLLSELGVILLLFSLGLELRLSTLARVGLPAGLTALFEVGFVIALGTLVAGLLGFGSTTALFLGACLGISSTMLVAKAFEELGWKGGFTDIVFAILIFEDVIAILLLAVLTGIAGGQGLSPSEVAVTLGKLFGFLFALLLGGMLVVPRAFRWMATKSRSETILIAALAMCFGAAALASVAGYSVALGAFLAGVLIAESGHGHQVFELVRPLRDIFAMVFFVSVGMTIEPGELAAEGLTIAVLTVVVLAGKLLAVTVGSFLAGNGVRPAVRAGLSLAQIGEFSFVIANVASTGERDLLAIAVGIACVTTLVSPLLIRNSEAISAWVAARLPKRIGMFVSFYESWLMRLRQRETTLWRRLRRPIFVLVIDASAVVAIAIAASTVGQQLLEDRGLPHAVSFPVLVVVALALALPFVIGVIRRVVIIANRLAVEVIPIGTETTDLGRSPRRALILMFEFAIALATTIPAVVVLQPFVPASPLVVVLLVLVLLGILRRSIADFEGHVRAGSELILEVLASSSHAGPTTHADGHRDEPLEQVPGILPGFEGLESITLGPDSHATGRTLAELDLRARTGATVLAIARGASGVATPSPTEPLLAGDVLALAGSADAIAAARAMLAHGSASMVLVDGGATTTSEHHGP